MEIRLMSEQSFILSKQLWKRCFEGDDDRFVDWYYSERTSPRFALGAFIGSDPSPIGMLHMLLRLMRFNGKDARVCFVAGVATDPAFRRRGVCSRLFSKAFELMRERGFEASALQPFDTGFYERFGYKTYVRLRKITISGERLNSIGRTAEQVEPDPERLFEQYSAFVSGRTGYSLRSPGYFRGFIEEFKAPGARLIADSCGCCAGYEENGGFTAYELFSKKTGAEDILALLPGGYGSVTLYLPEDIDAAALARLVGPGFDSEVVPFLMLAPVSDKFSAGCGSFYCIDRY